MGRTTTMTLSLRLLLVIIILFISKATANSTSQQFEYFCDSNNERGNYTANSTYLANLNTVLSNLISNTEINYGFYNSSYGKGNDRVNAIGLCRGDIKPDECRSCLAASRANLTQLCPNRKEAIGWYNDEICMLRYSDRTIFGVMEDGRPAYIKYNDNNSMNPVQFNQDVRNLLDNLKAKAASGDSQFKYAAGNGGPDKYIYGLVQCTPDLSGSSCSDCLNRSFEWLQNCCIVKIGGRAVRPSCHMRYETSSSPFYGPAAYTPPPSPQGKSSTSTIIIAAILPSGVVVVVLSFIIYTRVRKSKKNFERINAEEEDQELKIMMLSRHESRHCL